MASPAAPASPDVCAQVFVVAPVVRQLAGAPSFPTPTPAATRLKPTTAPSNRLATYTKAPSGLTTRPSAPASPSAAGLAWHTPLAVCVSGTHWMRLMACVVGFRANAVTAPAVLPPPAWDAAYSDLPSPLYAT